MRGGYCSISTVACLLLLKRKFVIDGCCSDELQKTASLLEKGEVAIGFVVRALFIALVVR